MIVETTVRELKDIVRIAKLESSVSTGIDHQKRRFFEEALLRFDAENNRVQVSKTQTEPPMLVYHLKYDIDNGKVHSTTEVGVSLETMEKILNSFNEEDKIRVYEDGNYIVFERQKPKKRVVYNPISLKNFGDDWRWESPYRYDAKKGILYKNDTEMEVAIAVVSPETILNELKASSFTAYNKIEVNMEKGLFRLRLGQKLLYTESELSGTVKGEVNASYAVGFDNIVSTLAKFGGMVDLVFIKPNNILYVYYASGKFVFQALIPSIIEEDEE